MLSQILRFLYQKIKTICRGSKPECSYLTLPSPTSYTCACPTGVQISAGKCNELPSEYLLFTTKTSIKRISLESDLYADVTLPLDNLTNVVALDYHYGYQVGLLVVLNAKVFAMNKSLMQL